MNWELIKRYDGFEDANRKVFGRFEYTFIFWLLGFIGLGLAAVCGMIKPQDGDTAYMSFIYGVSYLVQMSMLQRTNYSIMESNKPQNEFEKLLYVPLDLRSFFITKVLRMVKYYMLYAVVIQVFTLFIHLLANGGRFNLLWGSWIPLIAGVVAVLLNASTLYLSYTKGLKQS